MFIFTGILILCWCGCYKVLVTRWVSNKQEPFETWQQLRSHTLIESVCLCKDTEESKTLIMGERENSVSSFLSTNRNNGTP